MRRRLLDGQLQVIPSFLNTVARLSLYDGDPAGGGGGGGGGAPEVPKVGDQTLEDFAKTYPKVMEHIGTQAVTKFKDTLPKVPEKYDVKLPDKSILPPTTLERATAIARKFGLHSNEMAQELIGFTNGEVQQVVDKIIADHKPGGAAFEAQATKHKAAALADKDLGSGKPEVLQAKVARATAFTKKHFGEDVVSMINEHGIGNHPEFLKAIVKLADLAKEDGVETGDGAGKDKLSVAERIYGKDKPQTGATS